MVQGLQEVMQTEHLTTATPLKGGPHCCFEELISAGLDDIKNVIIMPL